MKIKFNWRAALLVFAVLQSALLLTGCGNTVSEVSGLLGELPTLLAAIGAFVAGLGSTVSSAVQSETQTVVTDTTASVNEANQLLKTWTQAASSTVLGKIGALLTTTQTTLSNFLGSITSLSPAAAQKLTEIVQIATTAFSGVLALIPLFAGKLGSMSVRELAAFDKQAAPVVKGLREGMKDRYKVWREEATGDALTDAALGQCPKSI